jgi:hypothetical protein
MQLVAVKITPLPRGSIVAILYEFFSCVEFEDGSLQFDAGAGADQAVYLAVVRSGSLGAVYRETEVERSDLEKIIADFIGQFNGPDPRHRLQYP